MSSINYKLYSFMRVSEWVVIIFQSVFHLEIYQNNIFFIF
jgi:hypothetical protein